MSPIALVITDQETNAQIKDLGVSLLELRADLFKKRDAAYITAQIKQRKFLKIPLLLTLRNDKKEGAVKTFSDALKMEIITAALPFVDMVDIELSSPLLGKVMQKATQLKKKVIVSSHYLKSTPTDLESIFKKSLKARADIIKIAAYANSFADVKAMLDLTWNHRHQKLITMSLGPSGAISRLMLPSAGSLYTYTFLHKPTASGQLEIATLKSHLKIYNL